MRILHPEQLVYVQLTEIAVINEATALPDKKNVVFG
jgi:hypothetical protein